MEQIKTKEEIVSILLANNPESSIKDLVMQYADIYLEYAEATANINEHGIIVKHPRTMNPMENPYLSVRDKAQKKLSKLRRVKSQGLW